MSGIIGKKLGMGQVAEENGDMTPVTFVLCEPNEIMQVKTVEKDNTNAFVLGAHPYNRPSKTKKYKTVRQFPAPDKEVKAGDKWTLADLGEDVVTVHVVGVSKGKGFQGGVKRHNFNTIRGSHGTKYARHGSTGCRKPKRTKIGTKMPGHMGNEQVTVRRCKVVKIDLKNNVIAIKGAVPGAINGKVFLKLDK